MVELIEDATWLSPIVVVPNFFCKSWIICIDFKKFNATTKKDPYPSPFIDEVLDAIVGHEVNSFMDGFQQDIINP